MLQSIRNNITGVLALTILGLIILSFVFFGVATPGGGQGVTYVAKVNGQEVSLNTFRQQMQRAESQYAQYFPDGVPEEQRQLLRQNILDKLIREELVRQRIYEDRYRISNEVVLEQIKSIPQFQLNGVFDRNVYEQQLRIAGQSMGQFENSIKSSMSSDQLRQAFTGSAFVTPQELSLKQKLENEKRTASYALIPAANFKAEVTVTDAEIAAEYEVTKAELLTEEQVDIEYIELTTEYLANDIAVDTDAFAEYYEGVKSRYGIEEKRKARHILIEADESNLDEKQALAQSLLDQIKAGADFADIATANSDDTVSALAGGDLGFFGKGAMVPEFETAAFTGAVGEISELVKTTYGFHIIEVTEIQESTAPALSELSTEQNEELTQEYRINKAEGILAAKAEALANEVFDARDRLTEVAEANGLTLKTQTNIQRQAYFGIAANDVIRKAAFSDVLRDGTNSDLLAVTTDHAVFLRVTDFRDVRQKTLDEVKSMLQARLEQKAVTKIASDRGLELQAELSNAEELKIRSDADNYNFTGETLLSRNHAGMSKELLTAIFQAQKPVAGELVEQGVQLNNGDYAIFYLSGVEQSNLTSLSETEKQASQRALSAQIGNTELNAYINSLREQASIQIAPEQEELSN